MTPDPTGAIGAAASVDPMLAKAVAELPTVEGMSYEPKWDGFRGIVSVERSDDEVAVEIGSRGAKSLTRYFPELVEAFSRLLPTECVLDGEIVVRSGAPGAERLDWEALSQRIHPAASRIRLLSEQTPAEFVAFDLLAVGDESLVERPFAERRERLERLLADVPAPIHLTATTTDADLARRWLAEFEGAGLDGVVAKPLGAPYAPGRRTMFKVKHHREADTVVLGYRVHTSGSGVGSLLLGLYDDAGELRGVGGASAFTMAERRRLVDELDPFVERDAAGDIVRGAGERSRFSSGKDVSFVRLRPERVVQVRYDQMEGARFRHTVQVERWRDDRDPRSCTFEQLEVPVAYDLADVLR